MADVISHLTGLELNCYQEAWSLMLQILNHFLIPGNRCSLRHFISEVPGFCMPYEVQYLDDIFKKAVKNYLEGMHQFD